MKKLLLAILISLSLLASAQAGYWKEPFSHVGAYRNATLSIPNITDTVYPYTTEVYDALSEYNSTTGRFTATYTGYYLINASAITSSTDWSTDEYVQIQAKVNGTDSYPSRRVFETSVSTLIVHVCLSVVVQLDAGEYVDIEIYHAQGASITMLDASPFCRLMIDRIQ